MAWNKIIVHHGNFLNSNLKDIARHFTRDGTANLMVSTVILYHWAVPTRDNRSSYSQHLKIVDFTHFRYWPVTIQRNLSLFQFIVFFVHFPTLWLTEPHRPITYTEREREREKPFVFSLNNSSPTSVRNRNSSCHSKIWAFKKSCI